MTYEEFKEIIEKTGEYQVSEEVIGGKVVYRGKDMMCSISDARTYKMDTLYQENEDFLEEYSKVILEFAKTPIEDRCPVKKYYVKLEALRFIDEEKVYLNRYTSVFRTTRYEFDTKDAVYEGVVYAYIIEARESLTDECVFVDIYELNAE